jgi:hypothetical protein
MTITCDKCGKLCKDLRMSAYDTEDYFDSRIVTWHRIDDPSKSAVCQNCPQKIVICDECLDRARNNDIEFLRAGKCAICEKEGSIPASTDSVEVLQEKLDKLYKSDYSVCKICFKVKDQETGEWVKNDWIRQGDNKEYQIFYHKACRERVHKACRDVEESFHPTEQQEYLFETYLESYRKWQEDQRVSRSLDKAVYMCFICGRIKEGYNKDDIFFKGLEQIEILSKVSSEMRSYNTLTQQQYQSMLAAAQEWEKIHTSVFFCGECGSARRAHEVYGIYEDPYFGVPAQMPRKIAMKEKFDYEASKVKKVSVEDLR